jgi:hypothetical protein
MMRCASQYSGIFQERQQENYRLSTFFCSLVSLLPALDFTLHELLSNVPQIPQQLGISVALGFLE